MVKGRLERVYNLLIEIHSKTLYTIYYFINLFKSTF